MTININNFGSGAPLVFFHGWGFSSYIWMTLIPQLAEHYQIFLVDLPGFGKTSLMSWQQFKSELIPQLPQDFAVIGWSMGGLYASRLALEEPQRVNSIIHVCSSPYFLKEGHWPGISSTVFSGFYYKLSLDPYTTLHEFIKLQDSKSTQQFAMDVLPSLEGLQAGFDVLKTWDFRTKLNSFSCPVSYIFGRLDPIVPIQTMEYMQIAYPNIECVLFKKAAHMPFLSHPSLFIEKLSRLIK